VTRLLLALTLALLASPAAAADTFWHSPAVHFEDATGVGGGTGTPVWSDGRRTKILTCAHVVPHGHGTVTVYPGGDWQRPVKARLLAGSLRPDAPDLALLEVPVPLTHAHLSPVPPKAGDFVYQWGWGPPTPRVGPALRQGFVTQVTSQTYVSYDPRGGDSGAGVFDARGEMVGVIAWRATPAGCAVGYADVRNFLAGNGVPVPPQRQ
jgi:hypothetical protein